MKYLDISEEKLTTLGGFWTAKEISQQPTSWLNAQGIIEKNASTIEAFLAPLIADSDLRIILTGAGTSAFAGGSIAPALSEKLNRTVEAIATTDIVSNPSQFLLKDKPTLVVSFARSGNSPESVTAVEIASELVTNCYHLVVTCNESGLLFKHCQNNDKCLAILMPAETNDQSFAMTSSFTSMMFTALTVLTKNEDLAKNAQLIGDSAQQVINQYNDLLKSMANRKYSRVVFLGSGGLKALAEESALKLLELTDGQTVAVYDSPLGFRHGPKTIVNSDTLVVIYMSNDSYTRKYDLDLLAELRNDGEVGQVVAVTTQKDASIDGDHIFINHDAALTDSLLIFPYIVCAQIYAFHHALALQNKPDTPSVSGTVNRVVQGVIIHPLSA
ncbi:SIS domain-containing protein [Pseudocolwellia sp. HL-MZ19]|uniref:SIS domain-containing protein n=1 Tax=Pseudocolwellia sp. HL-MZ19 TaxID=3400846 RepID=UPI003CEDB895